MFRMFKVISDFAIDLHDVWHFAFFRNIRIFPLKTVSFLCDGRKNRRFLCKFVFRGLKEDVSLFEVEGFSLMTLVTIMEFIL